MDSLWNNEINWQSDIIVVMLYSNNEMKITKFTFIIELKVPKLISLLINFKNDFFRIIKNQNS